MGDFELRIVHQVYPGCCAGLDPLADFYSNIRDESWKGAAGTPRLEVPRPLKDVDEPVALEKAQVLQDKIGSRFLYPVFLREETEVPVESEAALSEGKVVKIREGDGRREYRIFTEHIVEPLRHQVLGPRLLAQPRRTVPLNQLRDIPMYVDQQL